MKHAQSSERTRKGYICKQNLIYLTWLKICMEIIFYWRHCNWILSHNHKTEPGYNIHIRGFHFPSHSIITMAAKKIVWYSTLPVAKLLPSEEKHNPVTESPCPFNVFKSNGWCFLFWSYIRQTKKERLSIGEISKLSNASCI